MLAAEQDTKLILDGRVKERAIIYARVSTDEQGEYGTSLGMQIQKSREYAQTNGLEIVAEFREEFTGKVLERPELAKARALLQAGQADALIVYKTNRLDRSEWGVNLLVLLQELKSLGATLHYSQDKKRVDLHNPIEALMQSISGWQAGEDHRETVTKMWEGRRNRASEGYVVPAMPNPPYGYDKVYNEQEKRWHFVINEKEAQVIRLIFRWYAIGDESGIPLTAGKISQKLTDMEIPTKFQTKPKGLKIKRKKPRWYCATIYRFLSNRTYNGIWEYGKKKRENGKWIHNPESHIIEVEVPKIIDDNLWELTQKRKNERKLKSNRQKHKYLLTGGFCKCGHCGYSPAGTSATRGYHYYICRSRKDKELERQCDMSSSYNADKLDQLVWDWLVDFIQDEGKLREGFIGYAKAKESEIKPLQHNLNLIDSQIQELESNWQNLSQSFKVAQAGSRLQASIAVDIEMIEKQIAGLEKKRNQYQKELSEDIVTEEDFNLLLKFVRLIKDDLDVISHDYDSRRLLLSRLNIIVTLFLDEGGKKMLTIRGKIHP